MTRSLRRTAAVAALVLTVGLLAPVTALADTVALAVSITATSPVDVVADPAATLAGQTGVAVTASTDVSGSDTPAQIELLVDGSVVDIASCDTAQHTCSPAGLAWDATGESGVHSVTARVTTAEAAELVSDPVSVTVSNPDPSVSVTSPSAGATVSGTSKVQVSASTDPALTDYPKSVAVTAGPALVGTVTCTGATDHTCPGSVDWDATALSGPVTLVATVTTTNGVVVQSASVTVTVSNPAPLVSVTSPTGGAVVKGPVTVAVGASTAAALTDYPASIAVTAGATSLGSITCDGAPARACSGSVPWDATGLSGPVDLVATVTTTRGVIAQTSSVSVTASTPAPTVSLSSPDGTAPVSGTVFAAATASTDAALSDYPAGLDLLADGVVVDSKPCTGTDHTCDLALSWDASGLTGSHTMQVRVTTTRGVIASGSVVTVDVTTPPVDVSILSPAGSSVLVGAGATAVSSGVVGVVVHSVTDSGQSDVPATVEVFVDSVLVGTANCPPGVHQCDAVVPWNTAGYAGLHRLAARVTTTLGLTSSTATFGVYARSGTRTTFTATRVSRYGGVVTIRGRVTSTTTGRGVPGAIVRLSRDPAVGLTRTGAVRTAADGTFAWSFPVTSYTVVRAAASNGWAALSRAIVGQLVQAPLGCSTSVTRIASGRSGTGVCATRLLPLRTGVALRVLRNGRWTTLATGRTSSTTRIPFSFRFVPRGTYYLQVRVAQNKIYAATSSRLLPVVVR